MNSVSTETAGLTLHEKRELLAQSLKPGSSEETSNLSREQRRLWMLRQLGPTASTNLRCVFELTGVLNSATFGEIISEVIARHEILRSKFVDLEGRPLRIAAPARTTEMPVLDLRSSSKEEQKREVRQLLAKRLREPVDISRGMPARVLLIQTQDEQHLLLIGMDEIAGDQKSVGLLAREAVDQYNTGKAATPKATTAQYGDFVRLEREWLQGDGFVSDLEYWKQALADATPLDLPLDHARPATKTHNGSLLSTTIPEEVVHKLEALGKREGSSLFVTVLAAFQLLMARYSRQEDILVGTQADVRASFGCEKMIGQFSNPLVLRTRVSRSMTFLQMLAGVQQTIVGAQAHQKIPFEKLVERMQPERDLSRTPLFQVMFLWEEDDQAGGNPGRLSIRLVDAIVPEAKYDLTLSVARRPEGLVARMEYSVDLFEAETIERMLGHLQNLLEEAVSQPEQRIGRLRLLTQQERHQVVEEFNATVAEFPAEKCVHELIEAQSAKTPNVTAVVYESQRLSFGDLNASANQLAHHLRGMGVGPESRVVVCMERSLDIVVALLATMKAGGCYVPLDPAYPEDRLRYMVADARPVVVLTHNRLRAKLPANTEVPVVYVDSDSEQIGASPRTNPARNIGPESLAYVIYTSGSTGMPKGVMVSHRSVVNNLWWRQTSFQLTPEDKVMQQSSFSFDPSVWSTFWPLIAGAQLVLVPDRQCSDPLSLARIITQQGITAYTAVPSLNTVLLETPGVSFGNKLRYIFSGGESLTADLRKVVGATTSARLYNMYGPTEATIDATFWECPLSGALESTPIGRPIPNAEIYLLDEDLQPVPVGVPGEIYIGGAGLARGYQGAPHMTAEKFLPDPFSGKSGARLYRSGDLGRFRKEGNIEFAGRIDDQVKIRGVRVELEEIEVALRSHPLVADCAAAIIAAPGGGDSLAAYVVTRGRLSSNELAEHASKTLTGQMIPQHFMFLTTLPRLPNGKLDRKALPMQTAQAREREFVEPQTDMEREIAAAFVSTLGLEKISIDDNFFDVGGNSLLIALLAARLSSTYEMDLPLPEIFDKATVRGVARVVDTYQKEGIKGVMRFRTTAQLEAEAVLDPSITPEGLPIANLLDPRNVFLTGATGYLGAFILERLLRTTRASVHCLVRASGAGADSVPMWVQPGNEESVRHDSERVPEKAASQAEQEGFRRIKETLQLYRIWDDSFESRVLPVVGNLAKPLLGVTLEKFNELAGTIDAIYHSGAFVNFLYPYESLKPANVLGTQEVLRLATTKQLKSVHHISTQDVLLGTHIPRPFIEDETPLTHPVDAPDGYPRSKWVAEKIVNIARQRGIPVCIFRPGLIMSHTETGATQISDYLLVNLKGYIQLGIMPEEFHLIQVAPVDYVAAAIVHISTQRESFGKFFHLWPATPILMSKAHEWVRTFGYELNVGSFKVVREVVVNVDQSSPLYPFVPFYRREPEERILPSVHDPKVLQHLDLTLEVQNTVNGLKGSGIQCPPMSEELTHRCLQYLVSVGFLPPPAARQQPELTFVA
jgi:myxalamid-type nonribosomal peptide synthetase MxaA